MIKRDKYLNRLKNNISNGFVKVLIGVRRSGKSTILKQLMEYFIEIGTPKNSIGFIDFEKSQFWKYKNSDELHSYVDNLCKNGKGVLFIDEVQEMTDWALIVNSLRASYDVDIYVTGSNARVFSGEYLTYLAGRYKSIHIYPLSFLEYLDYMNIEDNPMIDYSQFYEKYILGSFPQYVIEENEIEKEATLFDIFDSVFRRDIIQKGKIKDEIKFQNVIRYIYDNVGSETSLKKIRDTLKTYNELISIDAIENYLLLLLNSYMLYHCPRFDLTGKKLLKTNGKYYAVDLGIKRITSNNININRGKVFENFIYLELIKAGYRVNCLNVGRDYEVDFLAEKGEEKIYIQATLSLSSDETLEREQRPFKYIKDSFPKYIITLDNIIVKSDYFVQYNFYKFIKKINENKKF